MSASGRASPRPKDAGKYKGRPASIDAYEVKRVARLIGPAAAARQLGIARSSVNRMLGDTPLKGASYSEAIRPPTASVVSCHAS